MFKVAVLSSGGGTNFQSLIDAKRERGFHYEIVCLVANKACGAVEKAKAAGIPVQVIESAGKSREAFDREVMMALEPYAPDLIVLGGYMRIVGPEMVQRYSRRIINVHPSLLPKFAGGMDLEVHRAVIAAGEKESGVTVHFVDEGVDSGPVLLQKSVAIEPGETPESLRAKVQDLEKEWLPRAVENLAVGNPRRSLWQHPLWRAFQEKLGRKTWWIEEPGASALLVRHPLPLGLCWIEIPRGPLADTPQACARVLEKAKTVAKEAGALFVRFSAYDPRFTGVAGAAAAAGDHHPRTSLILDLSLSEEELVDQMKPKGRYNIKLAQKHGVEVRPSDDSDLFHTLLQKTSGRDGFGIHPAPVYRHMLAALGDNARLLFAWHENTAVAGGLFVYLEDWGIYYYGASDHAKRALMAPYLLQWTAILEAKKRGCRFYDFLGIAPENAKDHPWKGVTEFKTKFGGRTVNYPQAQELILRPALTGLYRQWSGFRRWLKGIGG